MGEPTLLGPSGHAVRFDQSLPSKCTSSALSTLVAYTAPQGYLFRSQVSSKPPARPSSTSCTAQRDTRITNQEANARGGGRQPSLLPLRVTADAGGTSKAQTDVRPGPRSIEPGSGRGMPTVTVLLRQQRYREAATCASFGTQTLMQNPDIAKPRLGER